MVTNASGNFEKNVTIAVRSQAIFVVINPANIPSGAKTAPKTVTPAVLNIRIGTSGPMITFTNIEIIDNCPNTDTRYGNTKS